MAVIIAKNLKKHSVFINPKGSVQVKRDKNGNMIGEENNIVIAEGNPLEVRNVIKKIYGKGL